MTKLEHSPCCALCGSGESTPDVEKQGYLYAECADCGLSRIEPMPAQSTLDKLYQKGFMELTCDGVDMGEHFSPGYRDAYCAEKDLDFSDLKYVFKSTDMKVLDVGSANGLFLDYLAEKRGIRGEGIDVSKEMTDIAIKGGFNCRCMKIEEVTGTFDMVSMWDTLEHIREPVEFLSKAASILSPGGDIIIQTPCRGVISDSYKESWIQYQPPYHVNLFDIGSLKLLFKKTGFSVVRWVRFGSGITDPELGIKPVFDRVAKEMDIGDTIVIWGKKNG